MEQLIAICEAEEWKATEPLIAWAAEKEKALRSSQLIEDGFQRERRQETRGSNQQVSCDRTWSILLEKKILEEVHGYNPIEPVGEVAKGETLLGSTYRPQARQVSTELRGIMGTSPTPSWVTFSPANSGVVFADLQLMEWCRQADAWKKGAHSGWSILMQGNTLLRRRCSEGPWFFALGHVGGVMPVGWPAKHHDCPGGCKVWPPENAFKPFDFPWLEVIDVDDWEAMPVRWLSPMHLRARWGPKISFSGGIHGIVAEPTADPAPLLVVAAKACFWELTVVPLRQLAKFMGLDLPVMPSLFTVLSALLRFILKCTDSELADILAMRIKSPEETLMSDLAHTDEIGDLLDKNDLQDLETAKEASSAAATVQDIFRQEFRQLHVKIRGPTSKAKKGAAKIAARGLVSEGTRVPSRFPAGDEISQAQATDMCPPGCVACLDKFNGRWLLRPKGSGSISRSWGAYGFVDALIKALQIVWKDYLAKQGFDADACPVPGIFGPKPGAGANPAGSSSSSSNQPAGSK